MCLGVIMKLVKILDNERAIAELGGIRREIYTALIDNPSKGDYVIVHTGFAISKLDEREALERLKLFKEMEEQNAKVK